MLALDLFCGGGGAALGMINCGLEVVGVDINSRNGLVYPGHFVHADATNPPFDLHEFDFVWASPPCQAFCPATKESLRPNHPNLIHKIQELIKDHPKAVIENVPQAPIRPDIILIGRMVGLNRIIRKRHFETTWGYRLQPPVINGWDKKVLKNGLNATITTSMSSPSHFYRRKAHGLPGRIPIREARRIMGITIPMTTRQVGEAVPPAYAEFVVKQAFNIQ